MWAANALGLGLGCKINGVRLDFRVSSLALRVSDTAEYRYQDITLTSQNVVGSIRIPG